MQNAPLSEDDGDGAIKVYAPTLWNAIGFGYAGETEKESNGVIGQDDWVEKKHLKRVQRETARRLKEVFDEIEWDRNIVYLSVIVYGLRPGNRDDVVVHLSTEEDAHYAVIGKLSTVKSGQKSTV